MSFDCSRFTHKPWKDFFGPVAFQGRVSVDSELNEWVAQVTRRFQAGSLDTFGPSVYPSTTPDAFRIKVVNGQVTIGRGRMYVDGLLAENHGIVTPLDPAWVPPANPNTVHPALEWDSTLEELRGTQDIPFNQQPYCPAGTPFPTGGPFLVYLDVWKREITYLEDPDIVEKAVGIDTTGRLQTVWQVKTWDLGGNTKIDCSAKNSDIPKWSDLLNPPGGSLTTGVSQAGTSGPCCLSPNTGYTGLENQLYRVEIHQGGIPGAGATFKWSRDNGSVATSVNAITQAGTVLGVASIGRDNELGFHPNDWVEITDDWLELNGMPGELHRIAPGGVSAANKTITLLTAVTAASFPVDGTTGATNPGRHTRIRRWDQAGKVYLGDGTTLVIDLDAAQSTGDIPVQAGSQIALENGVVVSFAWTTGQAPLKSGDYWSFAARSNDGTVEYLNNAPPRGIHHHYVRLGIGSLPGPFSDCRTEWPPAGEGDCCECAACVTADGHNSGQATLQQAIDKVKGMGGGKICLEPGNYNISETIQIVGANFLEITGHGAAWLIWKPAADVSTAVSAPAILIDTSSAITLEKFGMITPAGGANSDQNIADESATEVLNPGVMIQNSGFVTVQECAFFCLSNNAPHNPAIGLGGFLVQTTIRNNFVSFLVTNKEQTVLGPGVGISHLSAIAKGPASIAETSTPGAAAIPLLLLTLDLYIHDNFIQTTTAGIFLDELCFHAWQVNIRDNFIGPSNLFGIKLGGLGLLAVEAKVDIAGNEIVVTPSGSGIVCGVGAARIRDNDVLCLTPATGSTAIGVGILLEAALLAPIPYLPPMEDVQVLGNRISGVGGIGIEIRAQLGSASLRQNIIETTGAGGIIMTGSAMGIISKALHLSVCDNQLLDLIPADGNPIVAFLTQALGIRLYFTYAAEIEGNIVRNFAIYPEGNATRVGIGVFSCGAVRISGNDVINVGDSGATYNPSAGITVLGSPIGRTEISSNTVVRNEILPTSTGSTMWYGIYVGPLERFIKPPGWKVVRLTSGKVIILAEKFYFVADTGLESVAIRGNFLKANTRAPLAEVYLGNLAKTDSCLFSENQCIPVEGTSDDFQRAACLVLTTSALVASNNIISGGYVPRSSTGLMAQTPAPIGTTKAQCVIMGNAFAGRTILPSLVAPWTDLNV